MSAAANSQAEVEQMEVAGFPEHDVGRLQVEVQHSAQMHECQHLEGLLGHRQSLVVRQRHEFRGRPAGGIVAQQEHSAVRDLTDLSHRRDRWVAQRQEQRGLGCRDRCVEDLGDALVARCDVA